MAPQPDNDNTPKAPDKNDKTKGDKHGNSDANKEKNKDFKVILLSAFFPVSLSNILFLHTKVYLFKLYFSSNEFISKTHIFCVPNSRVQEAQSYHILVMTTILYIVRNTIF